MLLSALGLLLPFGHRPHELHGLTATTLRISTFRLHWSLRGGIHTRHEVVRFLWKEFFSGYSSESHQVFSTSLTASRAEEAYYRFIATTRNSCYKHRSCTHEITLRLRPHTALRLFLRLLHKTLESSTWILSHIRNSFVVLDCCCS